jgi:hypothetical protein
MNLIVNGNPIKKKESKNIWIFIVMEIKSRVLGHRERIYGFTLIIVISWTL